MDSIVVLDYDPNWPAVFLRLSTNVRTVMGDIAVAVEHVGSTAVPGLAAKPIIDMSVAIATEADLPLAIERLATIEYVHRGNLGVDGREAFFNPPGLPSHHLYLCPEGSLGLRNHLAVRDYLRTHSDTARAYDELKRRLAAECGDDIETYIDGKTDFILGILAKTDLTPRELERIEAANRKA